MSLSPWLIGGPGRCGKTHLTMALWHHAGPVAGFPLEGLFTVFSRRSLPSTQRSMRSLLEEYVTRPRYIDAARVARQTPLDYLPSSVDELCEAFPENCHHPVSMIGWFLDRFAKENGRRTWAAFDLHPEFRYSFFRRHLPGLKLAIMTRDAREAICAGLFWRGGQDERDLRSARFKHSLILYCLAVQTGQALSRRRPSEVEIFDFNRLIAGDRTEQKRVADCFGISLDDVSEAYDLNPDFAYCPDHGFLSPTGQREHFLDEGEISEISVLTGTGKIQGDDESRLRRRFILFARAVIIIGRLAPNTARALIDFSYFPRRSLFHSINRVRQFVSDMKRSVYNDADESRSIR